MNLEPGKYCFTVLATQFDENGFIPSIVIEGESGHYPMTGRGPGAAPWYWGKTFEEAQAVAAQENRRLGISPERAAEIVASSMWPAPATAGGESV